MKLYHSSKQEFQSLEPRQAQQGETEVPQSELQHAIYMTSDYGYAVAMGSRPDGETNIDEKEHTITFEKPELFNPDEELFIYSIDSETLPESCLEKIDDLQYVIKNVEQLPDLEIKKTTCREVLDFYKLTNWTENNETSSEIRNSFKIV